MVEEKGLEFQSMNPSIFGGHVDILEYSYERGFKNSDSEIRHVFSVTDHKGVLEWASSKYDIDVYSVAKTAAQTNN